VSTLTVVRHGQARPFQHNADSLSETGEQQSRALADYWSRNGVEFDEVLCGSLTRHCQTAALAMNRPARILPDWNEYDAEGILRGYPPPSSFPDNRAFQKTFEVAMARWLEGNANGAESFATFRERVLRGLRALQQGASNRKVVLFTSGGPIGVLVQTSLNAPDRAFLDVNWRVRNCSISEFVFSSDRLSLDSFNAVPHLTDDRLRTFR
jgi:broad specificity phosphatase PhoE